jgi:ribonuclease VapC
MIGVDASALVAIYLAEPERRQFIRTIRLTSGALVSPVNAWEALVRAHAVNGDPGRLRMERLIEKLKIQIVSIDNDTTRHAVDAFVRFGKRTPAKLNMGDCFAYALAKARGAPLLFKGDDFAKTDVRAA